MLVEAGSPGRKLTFNELLEHRHNLLPDAAHELHDGIIAMKRPPQALQVQMIAQSAAALVTRYRDPYRAYVGSGIVDPHHKNSCLLPELAVSREPLRELWLTEPAIVTELLPICHSKPDLHDRLML